ncbi:hypothetical protein GALL_194700 [mine drainage metagenome]|uniref:Uncharacterized protein n=1 Tax=mine drainage metagenome TaxID=410659 RepID=A0A1J5S2W9_9ZZZZ
MTLTWMVCSATLLLLYTFTARVSHKVAERRLACWSERPRPHNEVPGCFNGATLWRGLDVIAQKQQSNELSHQRHQSMLYWLTVVGAPVTLPQKKNVEMQ